MPRTIIEWDQPRVLIRFLSNRQIRNKPATLKETSLRMGIGAESIRKILEANQVLYDLVPLAEKANLSEIEFLIKDMPEEVAEAYKINLEKLKNNYDVLKDRKITLKKKTSLKEIRAKEKKEKKLYQYRYFLVKETE